MEENRERPESKQYIVAMEPNDEVEHVRAPPGTPLGQAPRKTLTSEKRRRG